MENDIDYFANECDDYLQDISLDDSRISSFIAENKPKNTCQKTNSDLNTWKRWNKSVGENRPIESLSNEELDTLLCHFFINVRKINGDEYEPGSLKDMQRSLERYLQQDCGKKFSIIGHIDFLKSRQVLVAKQKQLRRDFGKGRKPNRAKALTDEEMEKLWDIKQLGAHSPSSLLNTVWLNNTMHFGWRGRDEHYRVRFGDVLLKTENNEEYLEWCVERGSKTRDGSNVSVPERQFNPKIFATKTDRCPVSMYKKFLDHRPSNMCNEDDPFYLAVIFNPRTSMWYKSSRLGEKPLGNVLKNMAKAAGFNKKISNHSARRTMISNLKHKNVDRFDICQITGHRNPKSIDDYSEMSFNQQKSVSNIISHQAEASGSKNEMQTRIPLQDISNVTPVHKNPTIISPAIHNQTEAPCNNIKNVTPITTSQSAPVTINQIIHDAFTNATNYNQSPAIFHQCSFYSYTNQPPKKRRYVINDSSSEED